MLGVSREFCVGSAMAAGMHFVIRTLFETLSMTLPDPFVAEDMRIAMSLCASERLPLVECVAAYG
jgi:hypothetical protein